MPDLLHGRFVWYELMVDDTKAAEAFYARVVGWNARPFPGGGGYTVWHAGEKGIGGMLPQGQSAAASSAIGNIGSLIDPNKLGGSNPRLFG